MALVGKYDGLWVYINQSTGQRWSVDTAQWSDPDDNEFTSFHESGDGEIDELADWLEVYKNAESLPPGGEWVNINEP